MLIIIFAKKKGLGLYGKEEAKISDRCAGL